MPVDIHPAARNALTTEADRILDLASEIYRTRATPADSFLLVNGLPIRIDIIWQNEVVIGGSSTDATAVAFAVLDQMVHIKDEEFRQFTRYAEKVQGRREFSAIVSVAATRVVLARWCQARLQGATSMDFMSYYFEWIGTHVGPHMIVIPIFELMFEGQWTVAGVEVRMLSHEEFRSWVAQRTELLGRPDESQTEYDEWRTKIGNRAAAFVSVVSEPIRAQEIAEEKVDRVLSVLRSYSSAMLHPEGRSFCTMYGMEHLESRTVISINPDGWMQLAHEPIGGSPTWNLTEEKLRGLVQSAFIQTSALLEHESPTEFQSRALQSIVLYSRAALEHRIESKLLYILSALEFMLIMNDGEPISANLTRRFGYFVGQSLESRRSIQRRLKDVYTQRSKFVHHGRSVDNLLLIQEFLKDAWVFFRKIADVADQYRDKAAFLSAIDDEMLSGPSRVSDEQ